MFGAVLVAVVAVRQPEVGGMGNLLTHPISKKPTSVPENDPSEFILFARERLVH
jgi:hypothetical protein